MKEQGVLCNPSIRRVNLVRSHVSNSSETVDPHPFDDANAKTPRGNGFPRAAVFLDALWQESGLPFTLRHGQMPSGLRPLQPKFWLDLDFRNARLSTELGLKRKILDVARGGELALDREVQATHTGRLG